MSKYQVLKKTVEKLYESKRLPFHGWHHVLFVFLKSGQFSESIEADVDLTQAAALVHDLNYVVDSTDTKPNIAKEKRASVLSESGFNSEEVYIIEQIILEAHTETRGTEISLEAQALSDADTLFKALPITPVLFASKFLEETNYTIFQLAKKVVDEQNPLMEKDVYFYTPIAREKYMTWAKTNLDLWNNISSSLDDEDVKIVLETAQKFDVV